MEIHDVQFPLAEAAGPGLKASFKAALGTLLLPLFRARADRLAAGDVSGALGRLDRLLIAGLVQRHERAGTLDRLAGLHDWLWAGEQALRFHEQAQARFQHWWLARHSAIVAPLLDELRDRAGAYSVLCEIGCGSGLVLDDLSRRLPQLSRYIGIDLSEAQTRRNRERYVDRPQLQFESGDAAAWLQAHAQPGWIYFSNAGVLEYFTERRLRGLLGDAAARGPAAFAIVEPLAADHDLERDTASRPYGAERSWSHAYPQLFRDGGWTLCWQQELVFAGQRWLLLLARV